MFRFLTEEVLQQRGREQLQNRAVLMRRLLWGLRYDGNPLVVIYKDPHGHGEGQIFIYSRVSTDVEQDILDVGCKGLLPGVLCVPDRDHNLPWQRVLHIHQAQRVREKEFALRI